mgnify:CR=1 FL=1
MMPMANRLHEALDKANFDYTEDELNADIQEIENIVEVDVEEPKKSFFDVKGKLTQGAKQNGSQRFYPVKKAERTLWNNLPFLWKK